MVIIIDKLCVLTSVVLTLVPVEFVLSTCHLICVKVANCHVVFLPLLCRYNELLFIIDTCQAASMFKTFYSPNIVATGSSSVGEDSLSVCGTLCILL